MDSSPPTPIPGLGSAITALAGLDPADAPAAADAIADRLEQALAARTPLGAGQRRSDEEAHDAPA